MDTPQEQEVEQTVFACVLTTTSLQRIQLEMGGGDPLAIECIKCGGAVIVCDCQLEGEEWEWVEAARDRHIIERKAETQRKCGPATKVRENRQCCYFCKHWMEHHKGSTCLRENGPHWPVGAFGPYFTSCAGFKDRGW